jgi:hypothetical protein
MGFIYASPSRARDWETRVLARGNRMRSYWRPQSARHYVSKSEQMWVARQRWKPLMYVLMEQCPRGR